jgi:hypothetical protein
MSAGACQPEHSSETLNSENRSLPRLFAEVYEARRVYKLNLFERPPAEAAAILRRYSWKQHQRLVELGFAYERVVSGDALMVETALS